MHSKYENYWVNKKGFCILQILVRGWLLAGVDASKYFTIKADDTTIYSDGRSTIVTCGTDWNLLNQTNPIYTSPWYNQNYMTTGFTTYNNSFNLNPIFEQ